MLLLLACQIVFKKKCKGLNFSKSTPTYPYNFKTEKRFFNVISKTSSVQYECQSHCFCYLLLFWKHRQDTFWEYMTFNMLLFQQDSHLLRTKELAGAGGKRPRENWVRKFAEWGNCVWEKLILNAKKKGSERFGSEAVISSNHQSWLIMEGSISES